MRQTLLHWYRRLQQTARLMVGVPDYEAYLRHMRDHHPDRAPLDYASFFRNRQAARYGSGQGKCC